MSARTPAAVFLITLSAMLFEIGLASLFAVTTGHHFASLVVSAALLGIGAAGICLHLFPAAGRLKWEHAALLLGLSYPASVALSGLVRFDPIQLEWNVNELFHLAAYYPLFGVPFFLSSLAVTGIMKRHAAHAGKIYFADMAGAAAGGALWLLASSRQNLAAALCFCAALAASMLLGRAASARWKIPLGVAAFLALYPFLSPPLSPYKELAQYEMFGGLEILESSWGPEGRADIAASPYLRYAPGLNPAFGEAVPAGTGIFFNGNLQAVVPNTRSEYVRHLPLTLPYRLRTPARALIVGAGGITEAEAAVRLGAGSVTIVEGKRLLANAAAKAGGGRYRLAGADPRLYLYGPEKYDVISVPVTAGSEGVGTSVLAENYILTTQFMRLCLDRLNGGGILSASIPLLPPPRGEARLLRLIAEAEPQGWQNIAAYRSWGTFHVIYKKGGFAENDLQTLNAAAEGLSLDPVYRPGLRKEETNRHNIFPEPVYYYAALAVRAGNETLFNTSPPSIDSPFFDNYIRVSRIADTLRALDGRWLPVLTGGGMDAVVISQAALFSLLMLVLPLAARRQAPARPGRLFYFLMLGGGFMLAEVAFIQKGILYLGGAVNAAALVIPFLLGAAALGGLFSRRLDPGFFVPAAVAALLCLAAACFKYWGYATTGSAAGDGVIFLMAVSACGFFMGIPYPLALRVIGGGPDPSIPWCMAANGFASVAGAAAAPLLALGIGFSGVLLTAAVLYLAAAATMPGKVPSP